MKLFASFVAILLLPMLTLWQQGLTDSEKQQIKAVQDILAVAKKAYQEENFAKCATEIFRAQIEIETIAADSTPDVIKQVAAHYETVKKAHKALVEKGIPMPELKELDKIKGIKVVKLVTLNSQDKPSKAK